MSKQILKCESGHTWYRDGQRGRPPFRCPEWPQCEGLGEQITVEEAIAAVDDVETAREREYDRMDAEAATISETGDEVELSITVSAENPFLTRAAKAKKRQQLLSNLEKAREAQAAKREEEDRVNLESQRRELETIDERIARADKEYSEALSAASKSIEYKAELWDKADKKMSGLIGLLNRKRILQRNNVRNEEPCATTHSDA